MSATHLIVGAGKMGGALIRGWLESGTVTPKKLAFLDPNLGADAIYAVERGARHIQDPTEVPSTIHTILLAIKPQMVEPISKNIAGYLPSEALLISVLAGTSIKELERLFGERPVIRAMPNTPASIGAGITAITAKTGISPSHIQIATKLLSAVGSVLQVDSEDQLNAVTAISGSGPAYIFHLCEALTAAANDLGISSDQSVLFAKQTIIGAAKLLEQSDETASRLRENVTSPNGTTQAALDVLMAPDGLGPLMRKTCRAAYKRAQELSKS